MASFQDMTARLPMVSTGAESRAIIGSSIPPSSVNECWASALRSQINHCIHTHGIPSKEDTARLHKKLIKLIVVVLQPNSPKQALIDLNTALNLIEPYANQLKLSHGQTLQTQHYIERLCIALWKDKVEDSDALLLDSLKKVFPDEFSSVQEKFAEVTYEQPFWKEISAEDPEKAIKRKKKLLLEKEAHAMLLPNGKNPYSPLTKADKQSPYFKDRPLDFADLRKSFSSVAIDSAAQESIWKCSQGSVVGTLPNLPVLQTYASDSTTIVAQRNILKDPEKKDMSQSIESSQKQLMADASFKSITGREAVEIFTTKKHLNVVQFMYFNVAESRYYRPYDLMSVPEDKVNLEHYIFSTFGVLHVYPDGSASETMSLSEWNRMAVLWGIVSKFKFFKTFLISKSFRRWKYTIRRQRLMRTRSYLENNLIHAVPEFGLSLIHLMRLVTELNELQMLPNESCRIREHALSTFSMKVSRRENEVQQTLETFFILCKKVLNATRQECFDQLKHCEFQAQHDMGIFSKESLYVQRRKKMVRRLNLEKAQQAIRQLSAFMSLAGQIIAVHLLQAVQRSVHSYVYGVLCLQNSATDIATPTHDDNSMSANFSKGYPSTHSTKEESSKHSEHTKAERSVFVAKLRFNSKSCLLEMQPSPQKLKNAVCSCVSKLITMLCEKTDSTNTEGKSAVGSHLSDSPAFLASGRSSSTRLSVEWEKTLNIDQINDEAPGQSLIDSDVLLRGVPETADWLGSTPKLVTSLKPHEKLGLLVTGEKMMAEYNALDKSSLKNKLSADPKILEAMQFQNNAVDSALQEVEEFCVEHNAWLVPIREFTAGWCRASLKVWKGKPAREIENLLNKIKTWNDKIKNMDRSVLCTNRLLLVDCRESQAEVLSALSSIFRQLVSMVTGDARELSLGVTTDSKDAIKLLENKDLGIKSFAAFAHKVIECQQMKDTMSEKVIYIRELYEVVRMTYRQLTHDEEKMEERVKSAWEGFVFQLKDASNFVANQQPIILKQLDEIFQENYLCAKKLSEDASSGVMIDPSKTPSEVLSHLKSITLKFSSTRRQLQNLSLCRENIESKRYQLEALDKMAMVMEARLDLWKCVNISFQAISEWRGMLFRRFNVQAAIDKIVDWQRACMKFQEILSESDPVLRNWLKILSEYLLEFPLLQKIGDPAMKNRHWKQIFSGLGRNFEPGSSFILKDLLSCNLSQHATLINQISYGAIAEYKLEQKLRSIKEKWELKQFHLAKHIHVTQVKVHEQTATKNKNSKHEREGLHNINHTSNIILPPNVAMQEIDSDTYILVDSENLLEELSDSHVSLQNMLQSRHATDVRAEAELWSDTFQQIAEIIDLWTSCQDKWMYLSLVFYNNSYLDFRLLEQCRLFEDMDRRYREFVKAVTNDPKVLSVLSRRLGQKGWRELQGENLRKHILLCIRMQEELLSSISYLLEEFRSEFPRIYFLSDEDCVRLLAISRQPKSFATYILKCFSGIKSLTYDLPQDDFASGASLDQELNSHKLQVSRILGKNGEFVDFGDPLTLQTDALSWMKLFELKLALSLKQSLIDAIYLRSGGLQLSIVDVLEEVTNKPAHFKFDHWLLRYPCQIILLCESIFWTRDVYDRLASPTNSGCGFQEMAMELNHKISQHGEFMRKFSKLSQDPEVRQQLYSAAVVVTAQIVYHRDVALAMKRNSVSSVTSFEWQKIIKHKMHIPSDKADTIMKSKFVDGTDCYIEHMGKDIAKHGLEYESSYLDGVNDSHLGMPFIMTPLSDRFAFAICIALQLGKCATLVGTEMTGKSCMIAHLARIFGRPLININCSEELSVPILLRSLCGMVESHSFLCFDQAQLLPARIMTILVQQIRNLQLAFRIMWNSMNCQYASRGARTAEPHMFERRNSVPSLHSASRSFDDNPVGSNAKTWRPEIDKRHLSRLMQHNEDTAHSYQKRMNHKSNSLGSIVFNGHLLNTKSTFGMFMTLNCSPSAMSELPHNLKLVYRPITFIEPQMVQIAEVWLLANGFLNSTSLASKISLAVKIATEMCDVTDNFSLLPVDVDGSGKVARVTLNDIRLMITLAAAFRTSNRSTSLSNGISPTTEKGNDQISSSQSTLAGDTISSDDTEQSMLLHIEESYFGSAVLQVLSEKFSNEEAILRLRGSLQSVFFFIEKNLLANEDQLTESVHRQCLMNGLDANLKLISKVKELYSSLKKSRAVLLVGPAGCGKTTTYRTLAQALNSISAEDKMEQVQFQPSRASGVSFNEPYLTHAGSWKSVDITILYPNVLSSKDLFGSFENSTSGLWTQGVLSKILRYRNDVLASDDHCGLMESRRPSKWIILDGELCIPWIETVNCLLDVNNSARLPNMAKIQIPDSTSMIFEASNLINVSPSLLSRCSIVYCSEAGQWKSILSSWLDAAYGKYAVTKRIIQVWKEMVDDLVPRTLDFLQHLGRNIMNYGITQAEKVQQASSFGILEVSSFIQFLAALLDLQLDRNMESRMGQREQTPRAYRSRSQQTLVSEQSGSTYMSSSKSQFDDDIPDFHYELAMNLFGFAFVWSFGGKLLRNDMPLFDMFFRNLLSESRHDIPFPIYENVFEYFVDAESGQFTVWEDKIDVRPHVSPTGTYYSYVHQIERYAYLSSLLLTSQCPVLIMGNPGCGKSTMVSSILQEEHEMTRVAISAGMTPCHLQKLIESRSSLHLKQHNIGLMAHPNAVIDTRSEERHAVLFFLDDLSCAPNIASSSVIQPVHELVRQVLCMGGLYDKEHQIIKTLEGEVNFLAAATIPGVLGSGLGYSTHLISPRIARLFTVIHFLEPSSEAVLSIYHNVVQSWLEEFPAYALSRHYELSQAIIAGAVELYSSMTSHFKPTPRQPTYVFSLHNISQIMQGLFLLTPRARGRPRPVRKRPPMATVRDDGNIQWQRPLAGRAGRRFGTKELGDHALGCASPMMITVIRLWLHECSRTFHDRLTNESDRQWFSKSLIEILKKHFCTAPIEGRAATPGMEESKVKKSPRPSGISTSDSSNSRTMSSGTKFSTSDSETAKSGRLVKDKKNDLSTPYDEDVDGRNGSALDDLFDSVVFSEDEAMNEEITYHSFSNDENKSFYSNDENTIESLAVLEDCSEKDDNYDIQDSSGNSNETEAENSLPATSADLKTDYDDESQSIATAVTTEIESSSSTSKTYGHESTLETQSSISESTRSRKQMNVESITSVEIGDVPEPSGDRGIKAHLKRQTHARPGGAKLGVTFIPGLINDSDQSARPSGPLAKFDQILLQNEDPTLILFSKNVIPACPEEYSESTEQQLANVLREAQINCNDANSSVPLDLVFFRQAVQHLARLSRTLSLTDGGHAICFSNVRFVGRKSLCRLASYLCKAMFVNGTAHVEGASQTLETREILRRIVLEVSTSAGIKNTKTALLLDETFTSDVACLNDICCLVKEGQYPSLYSHDELITLASEISTDAAFVGKDPSDHHGSTNEKLDQCLKLYLRRVNSNLHIILLLRSPYFQGPQDLSPLTQTSASFYFHRTQDMEWLHTICKSSPAILTRFACIDMYQSWNHQAWMSIGEKHLRKFINECTSQDSDGLQVPWSPNLSEAKQLQHVCHVMSYIHQDALSAIKAILPKSAEQVINPITFRTMVNVFVNVATKVGVNEMKHLSRYEQVLKKIDDAETDLERYSLGRDGLLPLLHAAMDTEKSWKRHVEQERREYTEARERCSLEEGIIENLHEELVFLRQDAKLAFDEVNPLYNVAVEAMQALTTHGLDELKRYKKPPIGAVVVVKGLCSLFEIQPANWENGKALLMRDSFFEELEFFDKDNLPEHIYQALSKNVQDPEFHPIQVGKGSKAAECLCRWMHAIHSYAKLSRYLAPKIARLKQAESKMKKAQATLGAKRVRCNQIKEELDLKIQQHKNAYTAVKQYEQDLENLESKITKAQILMGNLAEYISLWRKKRGAILSRLNCAIGDSLLTAACLTYHSALSNKQRKLSLQRWREACLLGFIDKSAGTFEISAMKKTLQFPSPPGMTTVGDLAFSPAGPILPIRTSLEPYRLILPQWIHHDWRRLGLPKDERIHSAVSSLLATTSYQQSSWPLIFDADGELHIWMKEISLLCRKNIFEEDWQKSVSPDSNQTRALESECNPAQGPDGEVCDSDNTSRCSSERETSLNDLTPGKTKMETCTMIGGNEKVLDEACIKKRIDFGPCIPIDVIVCEADHPALDQKLQECVQKGHLMFITHLEKAELPAIHRFLLLRHHLHHHGRNEKQQVSSMCHIPVHRNFRLFLCTSVDMKHVDVNDSIRLPMKYCSCVDFALDGDGLQEKLNHLVLAQEKPDFENHHRLLEADIFHLEQQRKAIQMDLLAKLSNIEDSILSDPQLLDAVRLCKREMTAMSLALSETKLMQSNFLQKSVDLSNVSDYGRMLYEAVLQASVLKKLLYRWTASTFLSIFIATLKSTVRGKSSMDASLGPSTGLSPKSRAAELNQGVLESVLHCNKRMMFEEDYSALIGNLSLTILWKQDKMTQDELDSFILGIGKKKSNPRGKTKRSERPGWLRENIWEDAKLLEQKHPDFNGLIESLTSKQNLWYEYLHSEPVLEAHLPSHKLMHLGVGQKALLWKTLRPDIADKVLLKLTACVLGSISTEPFQWTIKNLLNTTGKNMPITFLIPTEGTVPNPTVTILNEAKIQNVHIIERSAPLSADISKTLLKCITDGCWLIIYDLDLERTWHRALIQLIYSLCEGCSSDLTDDCSKEPLNEISMFPLSTAKSEDGDLDTDHLMKSLPSVLIEEFDGRQLTVHENFRLWFVMKQNNDFDRNKPIPEILVRRGIIVNLSSMTTTEALLKHSFEMLCSADKASDLCHDSRIGVSVAHRMSDNVSRIHDTFKIQLSLLHTVIGQPRFVRDSMDSDIVDLYRLCGHYYHTLKLNGCIALCKELLICASLNSRNRKILLTVMEACWSLTGNNSGLNNLGFTINQGNNTSLNSAPNFGRQIKNLVESCRQAFLDDSKKSAADDNDPVLKKIVEIVKYAGKDWNANIDNFSNESLLIFNEALLKKRLEELATQVQGLNLPKLEGLMIPYKRGPISNFFNDECFRLTTILQLLRNDISNCLSSLKGENEMNPDGLDILESMKIGKIPKSWTNLYPEIMKYYLNSTITSLVENIRLIIASFEKYREMALGFSNLTYMEVEEYKHSLQVQTHPCYNLALFMRPDMFLQSLLSEFKQNFFRVEVLSKIHLQIPNPLAKYIIIDGIWLRGAVFDSRSLTVRERGVGSRKLPPVRLTPVTSWSDASISSERSAFICPLFHHSSGKSDALLNIPMLCDEKPNLLLAKDVTAFTSL